MQLPHSALLVAHDRQIRDRLRDILESFGIEVSVVRRSETAVALLEERSLGGPKRQFSLVVTERDMPHKPALALIDDLRETPALVNIPVLVVAPKISDSERMIAHRLRHCRFSLQHASRESLRTDIGMLAGQA